MGHYFEDECDNAGCPACGGQAIPFGTLGQREHFRCRACGTTFSVEITQVVCPGCGSAYDDAGRCKCSCNCSRGGNAQFCDHA